MLGEAASTLVKAQAGSLADIDELKGLVNISHIYSCPECGTSMFGN